MRFNRTTVARARRPALAGRWWVALLTLVAACHGPSILCAQDALQREYEIKAAFLYNFIRYIDFPAETTAAANGTLTIGIIGDPPVGSVFDPLNNKQIKGCKLVVKEHASAKDLSGCQIIFICASEKDRLPEILGELKDSHALTVSEIDGFAARGGIINFISERNKVRFEINPDAAHRLGFAISSDLLKLAKLVKA